MNQAITRRIRVARKERGMTQSDLAEYLERTAAAVSDLERGKVQVSAEDLHTLSRVLLKPIEYFYGEEFGEADIQDITALLRQMPDDLRKTMIPTMERFLGIMQLTRKIELTDDEEELRNLALKYYELAAPYVDAVNKMATRGNDIQQKLARVFEIIEPSSLQSDTKAINDTESTRTEI